MKSPQGSATYMNLIFHYYQFLSFRDIKIEILICSLNSNCENHTVVRLGIQMIELIHSFSKLRFS